MHIQEKREQAPDRSHSVRAALPSCLPWAHRSALLLYSRFQTSLQLQVMYRTPVRASKAVPPQCHCSQQCLPACECVNSPLSVCCSVLIWVKPFSRPDRVSVLVFLVGVLWIVCSVRSLQHTDLYHFYCMVYLCFGAFFLSSYLESRRYLSRAIWWILWFVTQTPPAISKRSELFFSLSLDTSDLGKWKTKKQENKVFLLQRTRKLS